MYRANVVSNLDIRCLIGSPTANRKLISNNFVLVVISSQSGSWTSTSNIKIEQFQVWSVNLSRRVQETGIEGVKSIHNQNEFVQKE